ncbi:amastin-like protein [Leishmania panamensis]|uniref:Amastin-like protein, putative n=1 Tax=Leishmania panamensis TaxID=5679 RepID=A0A088S328_LEIPA|nr:amastin-like protein [Leishmania panamensis]AIN95876.1 amastin-like protein [Leishmania panamensis]
MVFTVTLLLYAVLQFIAFIFVLVATPLDMFRVKDLGRFGNTPCLTLWGGKENCNTVRSDTSYVELWSFCPDRLARFRLAEVFAVISIFVYGSAVLLGFIVVFCCTCLRWICLALNIGGALTVCVVWVLMVFDYQHADGLCPAINTRFNFGNGFGLFLAANFLDIINIVLLLIPCKPMDPSKENTQW